MEKSGERSRDYWVEADTNICDGFCSEVLADDVSCVQPLLHMARDSVGWTLLCELLRHESVGLRTDMKILVKLCDEVERCVKNAVKGVREEA